MCLHAIFTIEHTENCFIFLIQELDDWLGIVSSRCSEYINCVYLTHFLQELKTIRSNIEFKLIAF